MSEITPIGRREFVLGSIAVVGARAVGLGADTPGEGGTGPLIVRNRVPLDAETPVGAFRSFLTPTSAFFIRSHFGAPAVGLGGPWTVAIEGGVDRPSVFSIDDLAAMEQVTIPAVLQCAGNGRANFTPTIPGIGWDRGAVGNAEWTGVRLASLLERAGVRAGMDQVHLHAADAPPSPRTPAFLRSIPLGRARAASTLVVTRMNGEPLPLLHGGPVRLAVPGWAGNHWIKWLRRVVVAAEEAPGFYMRTGYRMPIRPLPPGVDPRPGETRPVEEQNVKSVLVAPTAGSRLPIGEVEVRGVAWSGGEATVRRIEVGVRAGTGREFEWVDAVFDDPERPYAWRRWRVGVKLLPGPVVLSSRATDSRGVTQPVAPPWNKSGYLWNGHDTVAFEVVKP